MFTCGLTGTYAREETPSAGCRRIRGSGVLVMEVMGGRLTEGSAS